MRAPTEKIGLPAAIIIYGLVTASAQKEEPDREFKKLEREFSSEVHKLSAKINASYSKALKRLQTKLERGNETETATQTAEEITALTQHADSPAKWIFPRGNRTPFFLTSPGGKQKKISGNTTRPISSGDIPATAPGDITLLPKNALLEMGTKLKRPQEFIIGFTRDGASATWTIGEIQPGIYDVILDYSSGDDGGGGKIEVTLTNTQTELFIAPEGSWTNFRLQMVGGAHIRRTPASVEIKSLEATAHGKIGVLALRKIILRPRR